MVAVAQPTPKNKSLKKYGLLSHLYNWAMH